MRDEQMKGYVQKAIGQVVGRLAQQVQQALGQVSQDVTELSRYISAETLRRQVLEDMLFEKTLGGISKEAFEAKFKVRIEEYAKEQEKKLEELKVQQKQAAEKAAEEAEAEKSKPKIYLPGEV